MNVPMVTAPGNITHRYGYAYTKFQMWALEGVFEKILYIDLDLMFIDKSPLDLFARIDAFHDAAELKNNSTKETLQQGKEEGTGGSSNSTSPSRQKFYGGVEDWNYWFIGCEQGIGCINSGLLVFEPDLVAYRALIELIPTTRSAIYDQHTLQVYYQSRSEHENFPPEYNTMWLPNGHNKEHMEKAIGFHFRYFDLDGHLYQRGGSYVPQKLVAQTLASKMPGRLMDLRRIQMENFQQGRGGVLPIVPVQFAELTDRITMTELRTQHDRVGVIAYGVGGTTEALDSRQAFSKHLYQAFLETQYQPKSLLTLFKVILEDLFEKYEWVWVVHPSLILKAEGKWPVHKQLDWLTKDLNDAAVAKPISASLTFTFFEEASVYSIVLCCIHYSWARGSAVFRKVFPKSAKGFKWFVLTSPMIYVITVVTDTVLSWYALQGRPFQPGDFVYQFDSVMTVMVGAVAVIFDVTILATYIRYLNNTKAEGEEVDIKFKIISWYGVVSSVVAIVAFALEMVMVLLSFDTVILNVIYQLTILLLDVLVMILFAIKVRLYQVRVKGPRSRISGVKSMETRDTFVTSAKPRYSETRQSTTSRKYTI
ncbi:hypothetical protein HDU79_000693 [Rhizoclosmatium sp. JEL0117]|nr:hypothetical protein HDU79_000693 [Rhizoclosmatium sp. JEL0117]